MPIRELDPWRMQYFEGIPCPEDLLIPTEDSDAWQWYPEFKWVYDKLRVAESQGFRCGPHGVEPPSFPVFSKPVFNMRGMGAGSRVIRSMKEYKAVQRPGHIWMPMLEGDHVSTDVTVIDGQAVWWRHTIGVPLEGGMFDYWVVLAEPRPEIEDYCAEWLRDNLRGYTGMVNFETIGARIIEVHLRFADQWPDLYGGREWVEALIGLHQHKRWDFDDSGRKVGFSVVLFGAHGIQYRHPPNALVTEIRNLADITSVQVTFHEDRAPAQHSMPPGGFRLAIINTWDLDLGLRAREKLALSFWSTQTMRPGRAAQKIRTCCIRCFARSLKMRAEEWSGNRARIQEIENCFIPMRDGIKLAARIWLPENAEDNPVPAILEYIPYRKRDFMRRRDEPIHGYFASRSYVSLRVDIRGSGDSGGVLRDEYSEEELTDALEAIDWIAGQPWCDGNVGMIGISWGGFNALQVAALGPPALKAIISLCSTDDRYSDDAHYMGGCLLNENLQWGTFLMMNVALPPDPEIVGGRWRTMWRERLSKLEPFPARWMSEPLRSSFWKHGSVCEDFSAIKLPVYLVGGWADGYSNAIPRMMAGLKGPRKALIGPWAHTFPHNGTPGPPIGFLQEAVRWWDHWMKGEETGIMDEPALRAWMQDWVEPAPQYDYWPGRWVAEETWPTNRIKTRRYHLNHGRLASQPLQSVKLSFSSPQTTGVRAGEWCAFGADGEMPRDQRSDDGGSLIFDSDPLTEQLEVLGAPIVELDVCSDRPLALLAVRLCDVAPDGSSLRVSYGILNLAHRDSHEQPVAIEPGEWMRVRVQLNDIGSVFPKGHIVRVALSTSYWPIAWPSPKPVRLTMRTGTSILELPVRPPRREDEALCPFDEPLQAPATTSMRKLTPLPMRRFVEIDLTSNEMIYRHVGDGGELGGAALAHIDEIGLHIGYTVSKQFRILENDPLSAQAEMEIATSLERNGWRIRIELATRLSADAEFFHFIGDLRALEDGEQVETQNWTLAIPRSFL